MRILMLSQGLPFPIYRDGLTIRVYHLLHEFSRAATCHLIAFSEYDLTADEERALEKLATFDIVPYTPARGTRGLLGKLASSRRYYSEEFSVKIRHALREFKPDVVIAEQTFMAQYADILGTCPKVMSAVDAISLAARKQAQMAESVLGTFAWRFVARQRLGIEKRYFPKFDRITVVGTEDAEFLERELDRGVLVVPNGVDTEYFNPSRLSADRDAIVYTGNLSAPMNREACLYLLREVFPIIHANRPDVQLVIAGRDPPDDILRSMPPYVTTKFNLDDMRDALAGARVCVSPIAYGTGIKNNVLQSMAMGIPVVMTPLIASPIGVADRETGYVADRGAPFLRALEDALDDPAELERVGQAARLHIERQFSWQHVATTYFSMFQDLIDDRPPVRGPPC